MHSFGLSSVNFIQWDEQEENLKYGTVSGEITQMKLVTRMETKIQHAIFVPHTIHAKTRSIKQRGDTVIFRLTE